MKNIYLQKLNSTVKSIFFILSLNTCILLPTISNAFPIFAQQAYENPREATGRIVCANCHLAQKPVEFRPKVGQHTFRRLNPDDTWFIHWDQFEFRLPPKIVKKRVPCTAMDFPPGTIITRTTWGKTSCAFVLYVDEDTITYFSPSTRMTMTSFTLILIK